MTVRTDSLADRRRKRLASALTLTILAGSSCLSTGCSSSGGSRIASMNPFAKSSSAATAAASGTEERSGWTDSIANGTKNAVGKSRDMLVGWIGKDEKPDTTVRTADATDPTSLANKSIVTPEVFVANGRLWESTGNFPKAMESYAKALEQSPNDPAALANIARLHFRQGNHSKAAEYFSKAIKEKPEDAGLHNDLGLTLSKLGKHAEAAQALSRALEISPKSSRYANNLASVKFEAKDHPGALDVLIKNNKPAVAHFNMAYLHYKHKQTAEATRHLNLALAYKPQATSDAATKRAVERASDLLAQIEPISQIEPGTAIAKATESTPATDASATKVATTTKPESANNGNIIPAGMKIPGFNSLVTPAPSASAAVNYAAASYKTPAPAKTTPQSDAPQSDTQQSATQQTPAAEIESKSDETKSAAPTGFMMPKS